MLTLSEINCSIFKITAYEILNPFLVSNDSIHFFHI